MRVFRRQNGEKTVAFSKENVDGQKRFKTAENKLLRLQTKTDTYGRGLSVRAVIVKVKVSAQGPGIKSVSSENSSLKLLELEPATRFTTSLCESLSTSESDEVICCCTFLSSMNHAAAAGLSEVTKDYL